MSHIGSSPPRPEDPGLVAGTHPYVADIRVGGCLDAVFVRSYEAHGTLVSVDASEAGSVPGVAGAWAAPDLPELPDVPFPPGSRSPAEMRRPALARGRVRYVGEPVAVVLAGDRYAAEDGAARVMVEIDPLPPLLDPVEAAASEISLFDDCDNVAAVREYGTPVGDVMDRAPVVIHDTIRNQRVVPSSIEARAILVVPAAGGLTIWASHQAPHRLRRSLATALGLDPASVRVVVPRVGGAFGAKSQTYPEYVAVAYLSIMLGRPVRWIEDRREAFAGATHGRGQTQHLRLAADEEGRILALDALIDADVGAYPHTGELVPSMTAWVMSGAYEIANLHVRTRAVVTNQTPTASYRGAGRPEAAFAVERMVDKLAHRLGIDPAEIRRRNFIPPEHFPYGSPTGALYDSARHAEALDQALELIDYQGLRAEQARRRAAGEGPLLGIGMASYVERSGGQPGTSEYGSVEIDPDGTIVARSGTSPQGQGNTTALAQIVAAAFDADLDRVRVVQSDTSEVPSGTGTFASRSVQVGGSALHQASVEVIEEALRRGAKRFEAAASDVAYSDGRITSSSGGSVELVDLLDDGPLVSEIEFSAPQAFPFGTYVVALEIDTDTGGIELLRIAVVDDCGVVVNPTGVRGQTIGSLVQGIGQALFETIPYDEGGQPLVSTMMDYSLPTASEIPELRLGEMVTPNPNIPLGTKGAGEAGCIGAPPAIVNAVVDALGGYDVGIEMPVTPEKVWRALGAIERSRADH